MNWEKFISGRFYYSSNKQGRYLGLLSMIGMGIGSFAMIISISVMNGFEAMVHGKLKGIEGDISILGTPQEQILYKVDGITDIMPFMERKGIVEVNDVRRVSSIKAVDETKMDGFYNLNYIGETPRIGQVAIGQDLSNRLGTGVGDNLFLYSPIDQTVGLALPHKKKLEISGIFSTRLLDYDENLVFISLKDGQSIFKRKYKLDGYDLRTSKVSTEFVKRDLIRKLGLEYPIYSWEEKNQSLVSAMKMERLGTFVVLSLIFLVAAFNLASNLTLISIQKMKEVGVIRAMGAPVSSIYKMIILLGYKRAGTGLLVGFFSGIFLVIMQNQLKLIPLPSSIYFVDSLPMLLYTSDILIILIISLLFILIASIVSGRKLISTQINESLQWVK